MSEPTPSPTVVTPSEMFGEHAEVRHPRLADNVTVERKAGGGEFDLFINGEPFPWFVAGDEGADVKVSTSRMSAVTITILAKSVTVRDELGLAPGGRDHAHDHAEDDAEPQHG